MPTSSQEETRKVFESFLCRLAGYWGELSATDEEKLDRIAKGYGDAHSIHERMEQLAAQRDTKRKSENVSIPQQQRLDEDWCRLGGRFLLALEDLKPLAPERWNVIESYVQQAGKLKERINAAKNIDTSFVDSITKEIDGAINYIQIRQKGDDDYYQAIAARFDRAEKEYHRLVDEREQLLKEVTQAKRIRRETRLGENKLGEVPNIIFEGAYARHAERRDWLRRVTADVKAYLGKGRTVSTKKVSQELRSRGIIE